MELNVFQWVVWQLYTWFFVPKNLWYCDFHGKTVVVVPARKMEVNLRQMNLLGSISKRPTERGYTRIIGGKSKTYDLIFSDDPQYREGVTQRYPSGIVGSRADFELFCRTFPVVRRCLYVPAATQLRQAGEALGPIDDPAYMAEVIKHAKGIYRHGRSS